VLVVVLVCEKVSGACVWFVLESSGLGWEVNAGYAVDAEFGKRFQILSLSNSFAVAFRI